MNDIEGVFQEVLIWGRSGADSPWPTQADGLIDLMVTGLNDLGAKTTMPSTRFDGQWVAELYRALGHVAQSDFNAHTAARMRDVCRIVRELACYHLGIATSATGSLDNVAAAWNKADNSTLRISLSEVIGHFGRTFGVLGRVPHCGDAGRDLLPPYVKHDGPGQFIPPRPRYRYAGDDMAEVALHFGFPLFVDTKDDSVSPDIINTGLWEPWNDGIVRRCVGPGDVVVNIGGNLGYYMVLASSLVGNGGRVFCFEPNPRLVRLISRSIRWGGLAAIAQLFPFAASNARGRTRFAASPYFMGGGGMLKGAASVGKDESSFDEPDRQPDQYLLSRLYPYSEYDVWMTTVDTVVTPQVKEAHFMVVDVEGAEPLVFEGARELIKRSRDLTMIVEWGNGVTYAKTPERREQAVGMIEWLTNDGFKFWRISGDTRDIYCRAAILTPISPADVLGMTDYCDLFMCRQ